VSLDLNKVAAQVTGMVARLSAESQMHREHLQHVLETLGNVDLASLQKKVDASRTTWLVAGLVEDPLRRFPPTGPPGEFAVAASDGSHIGVDRHRAARCFLINIGAAVLRYGASPGAFLNSYPRLYTAPEELVVTPKKGREQFIEGNLLGVKRSVDECRCLADLSGEIPTELPALALVDGSLIMWGLEAFPDFVTDVMLVQGFLPCLDDFKALSGRRRLALASYISFPRSTDVVNTLRVAICPHEPADCDRFCPERQRDCDILATIQDREVFAAWLEPGERSALFASRSKIVEKQYREHRVYFFYLRLEDEVARVEVPQWVAQDEDRLLLTHSLVLDQCRRGLGYPAALSEAHEQAVVTTTDKTEFWRLVESLMEEAKIPVPTSAKSFSKKTRWL
jgi:hypothetical protein